MIVPSAIPPVGGTLAHIRSILPSLVPSESRVAALCLADPEFVVAASAADVAQRTDTSPATVIRASQNLGFRGFQSLRILLARDLGAAAEPSRVGALNSASTAERLPAQVDAAAGELRDVLGTLDLAVFDAAAEAIASADRVLVTANGGSGPAGQAVALRLLTGGRPCEAPPDAVTQHLSARTLAPRDVCLAISDSGINPMTVRAAEAAAAAGAVVVGVTGYARSRLADLSTHTLVAGAESRTWGGGSVGGNLAQLLTLMMLQDTVLRQREGTAGIVGPMLDEVLGLVDEGRES